jgi:hypothetical protein
MPTEVLVEALTKDAADDGSRHSMGDDHRGWKHRPG